MGNLLCAVLTVALWVILIWVVLSWIAAYGRLPWGHPVRRFYDALDRIVDPLLAPVRRILGPVRIGNTALDLSPIVLILVIGILQRIVC
jgi:YggT family protein